MMFGSERVRWVLAHPGRFAWRAVQAFRANQGLLLAGAVAYYALLSIVPMLILTVIALSHFVARDELLGTLGLYLDWLVPGQSGAVVTELANFMSHRDVMGGVLLLTMLFFSTLAFTVLESAMAVIFHHRVAIHRRRHFVISAVLPYAYILCLGFGLLLMTLVAGGLQGLAQNRLLLSGRTVSLGGLSHVALYLLGFAGEVFVLTSIYMVMPVGRLSWRHALVGGVSAAVLWEVSRHLLLWYFASLSQISTVYGSLTSAIAVLLSLEVGAALLLFGGQVIAEFERIDPRAQARNAPQGMNATPASRDD